MKVTITDKINNIDIVSENYDLKKITKSLNHMSPSTGNYIKIHQNHGEKYIAHFSWISRNNWKIDCPIELQKVHKQCYVTKQKALEILEKLYSGYDIESIKGFIDVPIRHFTLDDMLQFKKEDDMMLKGQDPNENSTTSSKHPIKKNKKVITPNSTPTVKKTTSTPLSKPKPITNTSKLVKKSKPLTDDNSFFSI